MNERVKNILLFLIPSLIWGSTWYAIKFQLGHVNPLMSVVYRFALASVILIAICVIRKENMRFGWRIHTLFFLQGFLLFGINYWLVYIAEQYLTSGLIAVIFSIIVFTNALFSALFIKSRLTLPLIIGGLLAIIGTGLIFKREVTDFFSRETMLYAVIMSFLALLTASLGNVLSAFNQQKQIPVLQTNAFSMLYGSLAIFFIGIFIGTPLQFDFRSSYLISLSYLAVFGSVVAFSFYLKIIGRVGPAKASYAIVFTPVIAMVFSTLFEAYTWEKSALVGMPVLILGNLIAMDKIKLDKSIVRWK